MAKISSGTTLLFQLILSFMVLFGIYMIYALLDNLEADMIGAFGFVIFQPILGFIYTTLTILACLLVGLPFRLIKKVRVFWLSMPLIPLVGAFIGILLLVFSYNSNFTEIREVTVDFENVQHEVPNTTMSVTGWFLTAFSLLHFYPQALIGMMRGRRGK